MRGFYGGQWRNACGAWESSLGSGEGSKTGGVGSGQNETQFRFDLSFIIISRRRSKSDSERVANIYKNGPYSRPPPTRRKSVSCGSDCGRETISFKGPGASRIRYITARVWAGRGARTSVFA